MTKLDKKLQDIKHSELYPKLNQLVKEDFVSLMNTYDLTEDEVCDDTFSFYICEGNSHYLAQSILYDYVDTDDWLDIFGHWFEICDIEEELKDDDLKLIVSGLNLDMSLYDDPLDCVGVYIMDSIKLHYDQSESDNLKTVLDYLYNNHFNFLKAMFTSDFEVASDEWVANNITIIKSRRKVEALGLSSLDITIAYMDMFSRGEISVSVEGQGEIVEVEATEDTIGYKEEVEGSSPVYHQKENDSLMLLFGEKDDPYTNMEIVIKPSQTREWDEFYKIQHSICGDAGIRMDGGIYVSDGIVVFPDGSTIDEKPHC